MGKRSIRFLSDGLGRFVRAFFRLRSWQLLIILVLMLFVSATLLRLNNLGMVERRNAVIAADKTGDDAQVKAALVELQNYVSAHMNTSLEQGVYREAAYARDREAAIEAASNSPTNPASAVYEQASVECRARFRGGTDSFRNDYVRCVTERVAELSPSAGPSAVQLPPVSLYRFDFVSPLWTPDAAGFAVLFSLLIALMIVARGIATVVRKYVFSGGRY